MIFNRSWNVLHHIYSLWKLRWGVFRMASHTNLHNPNNNITAWLVKRKGKAWTRECIWKQMGQNNFELVLSIESYSPLFKDYNSKSEIKENTNQTNLKSFWPKIHFKLQHYMCMIIFLLTQVPIMTLIKMTCSFVTTTTKKTEKKKQRKNLSLWFEPMTSQITVQHLTNWVTEDLGEIIGDLISWFY